MPLTPAGLLPLAGYALHSLSCVASHTAPNNVFRQWLSDALFPLCGFPGAGVTRLEAEAKAAALLLLGAAHGANGGANTGGAVKKALREFRSHKSLMW